MRAIRVQQDLHHHLLLALEGAGIGAEALLAELRAKGITVSDTSSAVHAGAERVRVLEVATHLVGDPCLALRLGQMIGIASYGSFGFALMSCANLREGAARKSICRDCAATACRSACRREKCIEVGDEENARCLEAQAPSDCCRGCGAS